MTCRSKNKKLPKEFVLEWSYDLYACIDNVLRNYEHDLIAQ